eukprot:Phypoly_transcript_06137.p1 GENE.Phypoly_transcript_06137~~Phypoly_transcript_06137.p1  ORF type:complete len:537 (+),score=81.60 Phypoly_transcript_06137:102-1712(+)
MFTTTTSKILLLLFALTSCTYSQQYGVRMRWTSNAQSCTNPPDAIEYWPIGSPFAEQGSGTCVDIPLADGGHAYYTYSTSDSIPSAPSSWSPFYAVETYWENTTACEEAQPDAAASVILTNSDSCIFMGASTMGYFYLRLDCTSETEGLVYSCRDSACTDCRPADTYEGGCDDFVNSIHSCAANPSSSTPTTPASTPTQEGYGVRMRWVSSGCTGEPDAIDYWPIGSPFAEEGSGECVDVNLADGGHAYFTYTTSSSIPSVPSSWSPFYAVETYYDNSTTCEAADPATVELVTITNSDSCIFMGASTMGYFYLRLGCTSETEGLLYSCRDSACTDCRPTERYQGGCDDFVNSVHGCAANPNPSTPPVTTPAPTPAYGVRMRWVSNANGCTEEPDSIDYWPIGSPFADEGSGECVDVPLADGGHAYYTYTTSATVPAVPSSWAPYYSVETFYDNETLCDAADPSTVELVTIQNSDSCIFMGASTEGYFYMRLACESETEGYVYSCKDAGCGDCRPAEPYQGGCEDFVNSVHACAVRE